MSASFFYIIYSINYGPYTEHLQCLAMHMYSILNINSNFKFNDKYLSVKSRL